MKRILCSLIGIVAFAGLRAECSVIEVPLVQRVNASSLIVEGTVTEQYSYWNSTHTMIYTANKVELYKIFKGSVNTAAIEIITEGGTVGFDRITVEPTLVLHVGETGMFTCAPLARVQANITSRNALPQYEAYASLQGFVKYNEKTNTATDPFRVYSDIQTEVYNVCAPAGNAQYIEVKARPHATQRIGDQFMAGPDPLNMSPSSITAGTGDQLTIFGEGFGLNPGSVRFSNADDGGATMVSVLPTQITLWQDDMVKVEVPSGAGSGDVVILDEFGNDAMVPGTLTIDYAHLNVEFDPGPGTIAYQTDHVNDNGSGGYTWRMNTAFDAHTTARASFMRAFDSWRCATLVNWSIGATTSINDAVSDGTNIICFDNTAPLSAGILGVCYSYWSGCASGPTIVWYVNELDIIFDEGSNISPLGWEYGPSLPAGNEYDFETVAVHELGHGHQLGHVISPGAIMHYAISNGTSNRSLGVNDIAGGQFVQSKSIVANVCGSGAMSNTTCGSPPVAAFTVNDQTACVGQTLSFTDQSTGTPTQWLWTFTGGTPSSSTLQNPTVSYAAPGVYDVVLTASNTNGSDPETRVGYITVSANPAVGFSVSPGLTVCAGTSVTLSGTGAASYAWSGGINDGVPFTAGSSTTYSVTGTAANGCTGTSSASITVNQGSPLSISRNPSNGIVCTGGQATLTATGAQSYSWTGGVTNGVAFTPPASSSYTVTGTAANGCTSTATTSLTVQACGGMTQLTAAYCGASNLNMSNWLYNVAVPGAQDYQYLCTDMSTSAQFSRVKGNNQPNMPIGWISGLQYGHSYYVQVRAKVNNVWGQYGTLTQCSISMAAAPPATNILSTSCGATGLTNLSYIYGQGVTGSTQYWWTLQNSTIAYYQGKGSTVPQIRLNQFTGLQTNRTYTVTLYHYSGGLWSSASAPCTITIGGTLRLVDPNDPNAGDITEEFGFGVSMYPNPLMDGTNPTVTITGADQKDAVVTVLDLAGRVVTTYKLFVEGDVYSQQLTEFPELVPGMYIMQVQVGDKVQNQKFIAQ
jgi:PKD repeat protein